MYLVSAVVTNDDEHCAVSLCYSIFNMNTNPIINFFSTCCHGFNLQIGRIQRYIICIMHYGAVKSDKGESLYDYRIQYR